MVIKQISVLKPHDYNEEVFVNLEGEDFENLTNSISKQGLITKPIIDENNIILCGHQRIRAYKKLGNKEIECEIKKGLTDLEKKEFLIADNLNRRQLTEFQEIECYKELKAIESEKAKIRQETANKSFVGNEDVPEKVPEDKGDSRDKAAEKVNKKTKKNKSGKTYDSQVKKKDQLKKERPDLFEQFKRNKITLNQAMKIIRDEEIAKKKKKEIKERDKAKDKIQYKLIKGDLFKEIKKINKQFDLIYVDPPYNILDNEWDKFSEKEFKEFTFNWLDSILPKLKDDGRLYVSFSQWGMFDFHSWMKEFCKKYDLIFSNMVIWNYRNNMKPNNRKLYKYTYEPLFHFRKKNAKDLNELPQFGEEKSDVWQIATPQSNYDDKKIHPAQKPKELIKRIILTGCGKDSWILDPFAGSGTTGFVAKELGRNFIMIEKDTDYFKIMEERINGTNK